MGESTIAGSLACGLLGRTMASSPEQSARIPARTLGIWSCTALVIGNVVGSGVFLLPASLAPYGIYAIIAWVLTAVGAMAMALVFARLSRAIPKAGGPYASTRAAYGEFAGFWIAWGYWICLWQRCRRRRGGLRKLSQGLHPRTHQPPAVRGRVACSGVALDLRQRAGDSSRECGANRDHGREAFTPGRGGDRRRRVGRPLAPRRSDHERHYSLPRRLVGRNAVAVGVPRA